MKRFIGTLLSFSIIFALCIPAFAADTMESQIEAEIQTVKEQIFSDVYRQLEAQNALSHMSAYEEILSQEIEMSVRKKYGISTYDAKYTAPYGGVVAYTIGGYDYGITYLDQMNSYYYILENISFHSSDIINIILGYVPVVGNIFSAIFSIESISDSMAYSDIKSCKGYAKVMNVYCRANGSTSSVVNGWSTYTTMIVPTGSTNVYASVFQKHDPFE